MQDFEKVVESALPLYCPFNENSQRSSNDLLLSLPNTYQRHFNVVSTITHGQSSTITSPGRDRVDIRRLHRILRLNFPHPRSRQGARSSTSALRTRLSRVRILMAQASPPICRRRLLHRRHGPARLRADNRLGPSTLRRRRPDAIPLHPACARCAMLSLPPR